MVQHEVERQQPSPGNLNGSLSAVTDVGKAQLAVDGLAEDPVDPAAVYGLGVGYRPTGNAGFEKCLNETLCLYVGSTARKRPPGRR